MQHYKQDLSNKYNYSFRAEAIFTKLKPKKINCNLIMRLWYWKYHCTKFVNFQAKVVKDIGLQID